MQHLLRMTLLLWGAMIAGYLFVPQLVLQDFVQYPLVVLLSIFLPVSLWHCAQQGQKLGALFLAAVFVVNVVALVYALERNYSSWKFLERRAGKGVLPAVAKLLAGEKEIGKSRLAARYIFQRHSISVPYQTGIDEFAVYVPGDEDRKIFRQHFSQSVATDVARMNAERQLLTTFLLLALHGGIFVILLLFLLIYEPKATSLPAPPPRAG